MLKFEYDSREIVKEYQEKFRGSIDLNKISGINLDTIRVYKYPNGRYGSESVPFYIFFGDGGERELFPYGRVNDGTYSLWCKRKVSTGKFTLSKKDYSEISKGEDGTVTISFDGDQAANFWGLKK